MADLLFFFVLLALSPVATTHDAVKSYVADTEAPAVWTERIQRTATSVVDAGALRLSRCRLG